MPQWSNEWACTKLETGCWCKEKRERRHAGRRTKIQKIISYGRQRMNEFQPQVTSRLTYKLPFVDTDNAFRTAFRVQSFTAGRA